MWIKVSDRLPNEGDMIIASSGRAWSVAVFEGGEFLFGDVPVPTGDIIEWMDPVPSLLRLLNNR